MKFKDEYKSAINEISSDEAVYERIQSGVMKKLSEKPKRMPLKALAISGASAAACAVIGLAAISVAPGPDNQYSGTNSSAPNLFASQDSVTGGGSFEAEDGHNSYSYSGFDHGYSVNNSDVATYGEIAFPPELDQKNDTSEGYDGLQVPDDSAPYLEFFEDGKSCTAYVFGGQRNYVLCGESNTNTGDVPTSAVKIRSNTPKDVFVHFDERLLWIFDENLRILDVFVEEN